jgi:hypothetical protein
MYCIHQENSTDWQRSRSSEKAEIAGAVRLDPTSRFPSARPIAVERRRPAKRARLLIPVSPPASQPSRSFKALRKIPPDLGLPVSPPLRGVASCLEGRGFTQNVSVDPCHMDTFFLVVPNGLEQILNMKTSPSIANKGYHSMPTLQNPRHERFAQELATGKSADALTPWLDIEQTAVMLLG